MSVPPSRPADDDPDRPGGGADPLARWLADARADHDRTARRRTDWLSTQDTEAASFVGVLADLVDAGVDVVVDTVARRLTGRLTGVGDDVVVLRDTGRWVAIATASLQAVRHRDAASPTGDREGPLDVTLVDLLDGLAAEHERIVVTLRSGDRLTGRITAVGADVLTVALDGEASSSAVIAVAAVNDVTLG